MSDAAQTQVFQFPATFVQQSAGSAVPVRISMVASNTNNALEFYGTDGTNVAAVGGLGAFTGRLPVIDASAATLTLTTAQSGSLVRFNRASGVVITLPPPQLGLWYWFACLVSVTSNNYEIDTDTGTTFLMGGVRIASAGTAGDFFANGTSNVKIQMNGSTKGGLIGSTFGMACISTTQWTMLPGSVISGSGTSATPFA